MDFAHIDGSLVLEVFLLLLIGMGPKIALVPFLDLTKGMEPGVRTRVASRMVLTAVATALLLVLAGWILMRLLHFSQGAANVAGGIVLLLLALRMLEDKEVTEGHKEPADRNPMHMAAFPLAVPYLLNPAGIATLVILSSDTSSPLAVAVVVGVVLLVGAIDFAVFHNIDRLARRLDPSRLAVTEGVFGVLLAALAVQLAATGLAQMGIISLAGGH